MEIHLWLWSGTPATIVFRILSRAEWVYVSRLACDSWVAEGNKSQGKLASSGCTLIRSILLSLCALFSPSPNSETLNLLSQIHQGPAERIDAETRECVHETHRGRMQAAGDTSGFFFFTNTHTRTTLSSPGVWKPKMKQTYGDSPHDLLPNHVEQTETVASATTKNLLYMIYCTDTHR